MKQLWILFKKDYLDLFRTMKFLVIGIIFIIFTIGSPILAYITPELLNSLDANITIVMPEATMVDSYIQLAGNISQIGALTIIIALGGSIASERKKGLYNNLRNNGVKTSNFILSKVLVHIITVTIIFAISYAGFAITNYILFGEAFLDNSLIAAGAIYANLIFVICLANLFSAFVKSPMMGIILTIVAVLLLPILNLFNFAKYLPLYYNHVMSAEIFTDSSIANFAYTNFAITIGICMLMIIASIKFCRSRN